MKAYQPCCYVQTQQTARVAVSAAYPTARATVGGSHSTRFGTPSLTFPLIAIRSDKI